MFSRSSTLMIKEITSETRSGQAALTKRGMTLVEVTVVILILLTLITILFIGANIYKRGADRTACILNINSIHKAIRVEQNYKGKKTGVDKIKWNDLFGSGKYLETEPLCPADSGIYTIEDHYPPAGTAGAVCKNNGKNGISPTGIQDHAPGSTAGW